VVHGLKAPLNAPPQLNKLLSRDIRPQAAWSLRTKKDKARVIDIIDVLGRFKQFGIKSTLADKS
jgi:hypothetical protein